MVGLGNFIEHPHGAQLECTVLNIAMLSLSWSGFFIKY